MRHWKIILTAAALAFAVGVALVSWQVSTLAVAHSTFEHYYAFRGCTKLLERTDGYGACVTKSGEAIKIVKYKGRWFLDGDLPCTSGVCW